SRATSPCRRPPAEPSPAAAAQPLLYGRVAIAARVLDAEVSAPVGGIMAEIPGFPRRDRQPAARVAADGFTTLHALAPLLPQNPVLIAVSRGAHRNPGTSNSANATSSAGCAPRGFSR